MFNFYLVDARNMITVLVKLADWKDEIPINKLDCDSDLCVLYFVRRLKVAGSDADIAIDDN